MHDLDRLREAYEGGNKVALFLALRHCALWGEPMPDWIREALDLAYIKNHCGGLRSWNDIFGKPITKAQAMRERDDHHDARTVQELAKKETGRDDEWFASVGRRLLRRVRGKTRVKELLKKPLKWWQS